ncbi:hypothetical protein GGR58DRAFT_495833 [Xylaria digitata]|nr:hypothetical protein GGR58DRAFT_495833 [Xylaria digitata]
MGLGSSKCACALVRSPDGLQLRILLVQSIPHHQTFGFSAFPTNTRVLTRPSIMSMFANQDWLPAVNHIEAQHLPPFDNARLHESKKANSSTPLKRKSRLLHLLRLQPTFIYLFFTLFGWGHKSIELSLIFTCPLIFWDLVGFACTYNRFSAIPLEVNLPLEFTFIGGYIFLGVGHAMGDVYYGTLYFIGDEVVGAVTCFLISFVTAVYIYLNIRDFPAYRRYKRDYRKIKPLLAFTETGDPVAVFPPSRDTVLRRFSVDSLQEIYAD